MRSADLIINRARYRTRNSVYTYDPATGVYTQGVSTELFLDALNDAQDHLQQAMITADSNLFIIDEVHSIVAGQGEYSMTKRVFGDTSIVSVYINSETNSTDYSTPLPCGAPRDRRFYEGYPMYYVPMADKIVLVPIPETSSGQMKVAFHEELDDLDVSRGQISGVPAGANIVLAAAPVPDRYQIETTDYVCVSDRWGTVKLRNGLFSSYNSGTRTITLAANVSTYLVTGYALADLTGCYVTCGKSTTTHSKLPDLCERYLRTYVQKRIMSSRDDTGSIEEDDELLKMEEAILKFYHDETRDADEFPVLDFEIVS